MCLLSQCVPSISCMPRELGNIGALDLGCAEEKVFWIASGGKAPTFHQNPVSSTLTLIESC